MKKKKVAVLISSLLILALLVVGCSPKDTGAQGPSPSGASVKDHVVVGLPADAVNLDPQNTNDNASARVNQQIYETLVFQNEEMELVPGLAESWEALDDLTFVFKLKQGVKFHNGEELTANDVKFTLARAIQSAHVQSIINAVNIDATEVIDPYTIKIVTHRPYAPLIAHLAHSGMHIVNEKAVVEGGENYGFHPIGTGPFQFESWQKSDYINLVRFEDYHGGAPKLNKITFRVIPENTNRIIELETGGIDIAYDIPANGVKRVVDHAELQLLRVASPRIDYLGFNVLKKPFDDVRVRQAINYAVDVDLIIETVMEGIGEPVNGPLSSGVWSSHPDLKPYGYNVEKAKELMKEAGLENGFTTTLWTNDERTRINIAEIVQSQLKDININVEISILEWGAFLEQTANGGQQMYILGWGALTGDPERGLYPLFHSSNFGTSGNRSFYKNDRVDELLDLGRSTLDPEERRAVYMEAQELIKDDAPWLFLNSTEQVSAVRSNVKGFKVHPNASHRLSTVYFE